MIPKAEGDSTPLRQRPLCVLPVVYRLWASVRPAHLQEWFCSWVPDTVFSAGRGVSSVDASQSSVSYVHAVGQEASPSKCVLLSTSKAARRRMTACNMNEGCFWAVKLDVRDLGGHLDVTLRAVAGTLSCRVNIATTQVGAVGALHLGFQRMLGW